MKHNIYYTLGNTEGFVSGGRLGAALGITRAALWKHIKTFEADGAVIESVTGKGYRLKKPPVIPRPEYVKAHLKRDMPVYYKDSVSSTNDMAKAAARDLSITEAVFIAGEQTAGRGRKGRSWISAPGQGLYISMLIRPKLSAERVSGITLMAALAVCEAIENASDEKAYIKWPNDIIINGKKAAGILTESMLSPDGVDYAVCGIGINTNKNMLDEALPQTAVALEANNTLLAAAVIDRFFSLYDTFVKEGVSAFMTGFRKRNAVKGTVTLITATENITGEFIGYDEQGAIIISSGGVKKRFVAGEISLRGDKNYV
ncbi:MAG: biotin--[acetyl-CoA-carboxylase] ligase [Christensenellales bacterium]